MQSAKWLQNAALALFNPYNDCTKMACFPASGPNSGPHMVEIFSAAGAAKKAFCMSLVFTSKSFNAASVKAMQTDSLDTTLVYVIVAGGS